MIIYDALIIAIRGLFANKLRSLLTMLGVIIGVGSVITLVSIGEGVRSHISGQIQGLGSNMVLVTPGKGTAGVTATSLGGAVSKLTFEDALAVEREAASVSNVAPVIESSANAEYEERRLTLVSGTTESYNEVRNADLASGRFISRGDVAAYKDVVVLGDLVKRELFGGASPIGKTVKVNNKPFKVIGTMKKKGYTLTINNDDRVFIPITVAEELFDTEQVSMIFVQARSPETVSNAVDETKRIITRRHKRRDFAVSEQKAILNTFQGIMGTLSGMLGGIAGVSLIVGGIGIMNIMLVTVTERTREIGIRKALGAKRRDIMIQFLMESVFISAFGGVIGIGVGLWGSRILTDIVPKLPTVISPWSIITAFSFALLVGLFFGIYPATKASRLDPIVALRYE